jgi:uncharacterized protein
VTETASAAAGLPVTVVISRRPRTGREGELLAWANGIVDAAKGFPGHLGAEVFPPNPPDCDDLVMAFSFSNADTLTAWEHSDERSQWLARAETLIAGEARTHAVSGFEGIFARGPGNSVVPPARWRTAAIIALALYPMSLLLAWVLAPHVTSWNVALRVLLNVAIVVPYMAWIGVPFLTRRLSGWLSSP